jgi:hypothetical protein
MNGAELVDPRLKSQHLGEAEAGGLWVRGQCGLCNETPP